MNEFIHLINEMSPFLLLGFLLAGLMHAFIPGQYYTQYLSKRNFRSVINAAIFGIPLPLCSCGVIPTAMSLHREGASKGATTSFLIATPQTGVDSIVATYSLMGLPFALVRPIAALLTAVMGGILSNLFDNQNSQPSTEVEHDGCDCGGHHVGHSHYADEDCCGDDCCHSVVTSDMTFAQRILVALRYAYIDMMQDIGKWLIVGLAVAALITICVPDTFFKMIEGNTFASMLLVLCIAMPMYLCATGSIPVAVALMLKGLTPGAALVLLMAGPACNFASMLVVRKVLGLRAMVVYLVSIVVGAVGFGILIDALQYSGYVDFLSQLTSTMNCCEHETSWFAWMCSGILLLLLVNAFVVRKFVHKSSNCSHHVDDVKVYQVEGMNCNHCRMAAEKALMSVEGVISAEVELDSCEARVSGSADFESLRKAVADVGFTLVER